MLSRSKLERNRAAEEGQHICVKQGKVAYQIAWAPISACIVNMHSIYVMMQNDLCRVPLIMVYDLLRLVLVHRAPDLLRMVPTFVCYTKQYMRSI